MEQILQAALQDGFIPHKDDKFLFHGPGGVGKSSLIDMFLGKQRDPVRISTPVAMKPLHLTPIRDVSTQTVTANWEEVNYNRLLRMLAHTSQQMYLKWADKKQKKKEKKSGKEDGTSGTATDKLSEQVAYLASSRHLSSSKKVEIGKLMNRLQSGMKRLFSNTLATSLGDDPDDIEGFFAQFQQGMQDLMLESGITEVLVSHSIRIVDSGGQPQFHDLVSIFIPELSGLISVFKLSEPLAVRGEVAFYKEGYLTCMPYESHLTNEQVIRQDLQVVQSEAVRCGLEHMPNLAFVGTHLDAYDPNTCSETPDEKDERLNAIITEMLPEEMHQSVITGGGSLKEVSFRINARTPRKIDFEKVRQLKLALMQNSRVKPRKLPLKWHSYEVFLHMLMQELVRQCLSRRECEFIGHKMGFDYASLNAALHYLCQLNIISFYDVLPHVVFGNAQVILDKITELIMYSLELKDGKKARSGAERRFVQQGIVSLEFLWSPSLSKHYIIDLFEPQDLLKVLVSKLVITPVGLKEFMMPSVLEVSSIYPSPTLHKSVKQSCFIFLFSKKTPMFGIYCCTNSSLMSDAGWKLLADGGEAVQVARNSFTFEMPKGVPGKLTFLDPLSSYLEVILEFPSNITAELSVRLYCEIRDTFIVSIKKAMKTLNYEVRTPEVSFLCPEQSSACSPLPHPATVDDSHSFLRCTFNPGSVSHSLTQEQKVWLQTRKAGMLTSASPGVRRFDN